mmetsp:Transcript_83599/g.249406  ORF Transcript_83599/g.249406 Transcript_83599/m.249406 type:complete len:220 (+) Transcript_83599:370-1029(+)
MSGGAHIGAIPRLDFGCQRVLEAVRLGNIRCALQQVGQGLLSSLRRHRHRLAADGLLQQRHTAPRGDHDGPHDAERVAAFMEHRNLEDEGKDHLDVVHGCGLGGCLEGKTDVHASLAEDRQQSEKDQLQPRLAVRHVPRLPKGPTKDGTQDYAHRPEVVGGHEGVQMPGVAQQQVGARGAEGCTDGSEGAVEWQRGRIHADETHDEGGLANEHHACQGQ